MANPFKHSLSAIKIIKNDLMRIKKIFNYVVQVLFMAYFLYLIFTNLDSLPYIIIYSLILALSIAAFFIEPFFKNKEDDERQTKRLKKKQRRIYTFILHSSKYILKLAAIGVAIYEIATTNASEIYVIATIASGIILIMQVAYDFIVLLANRYMDIFQLAIEEDIRSSKTLQFALHVSHHKDLVKELREDKKTYTDDELKILELLENEGEEKKEKVKALPVNKELNNAYLRCKKEATRVLENKKEEKALFKKVNSLSLPEDVEEFKNVPSMISFVKSYKKKKHSYISEEKATSALASLIYLTKKDDLIPDSNKAFGYVDDQAIMKKSLDEMGDEYTKFLTYNNEKRSFLKRKDNDV